MADFIILDLAMILRDNREKSYGGLPVGVPVEDRLDVLVVVVSDGVGDDVDDGARRDREVRQALQRCLSPTALPPESLKSLFFCL